jgi:hypothetical protein
MDKYYIPDIEEFCLGFEFEYYIRNQTEEGFDPKWVESKVILDDSRDAQIKGLTFPILKDIPLKYYQIGLALKNKTIRVKKLDDKDIESFNFKKIDDDKFINNDNYISLNFNSQFFNFPNYVTINNNIRNEMTSDHYFIGSFDGYIKNKFELTNILIKIGYINTFVKTELNQ